MNKNKVELLAPAGGMESIYAAVRCGADAVYLGAERFSARAKAANFTESELMAAVEYCRLHNVKVYQAMNTLVFDDEINEFIEAAKLAAAIGVDALIIQDLGAAKILKQVIPEMKLHASTQMSVHTPDGARLVSETGFSRVVLSRELSIEQIAEICKTGINTEVFVHGALCVSVSGQCYMSAVIGSRSANRGHCAQACRLPFSFGGGSEEYALSMKDLSAVKHIGKLKEIGVNSIKIEGRMKRPEYVAAAVLAYRAAIDRKEPDTDMLRAVFSRSGFTDGYLSGKLGSNMFGIRQKEDVISAQTALPVLREKYEKETKACKVDFHAVIKYDIPAELSMTCEGITVTAEGEVPEKAENRPTGLEELCKQLSKLGNTVYKQGEITAEIDSGLILPTSQINALRRNAVETMNKTRVSKNTPVYRINDIDLTVKSKAKRSITKTLRIQIYDASLIEKGLLDCNSIEMAVLPVSECLKIKADSKIAVALPRFITDEKALADKLAELKDKGFNHAYCNNLSHIKTAGKLGFILHGGFGLNAVNSHTLFALKEMGLADTVASFECTLKQITNLVPVMPTGIMVYGHLPLMLLRNCPLKQDVKQSADSCKNCKRSLTDRTDRVFQVRCNNGYTEVLNSDLLVMSDKINEINTDFHMLDFYKEDYGKILDVISRYKNGEKLDTAKFTRGLYYRGVN